ncbi:LAME_0H02366g1_1 [Lachancea meyersii CBS 8951]|uniref:LAME_0H02366g1_1 n=1 Tax=Lachancea meyersii CBS 8951 TaxID=1266667 RepID=A0A1G4KDE3_9SACH|nr:LAME_0H02366g1_1 [Lachancea meyersii CBS 8951]
MRAVPVPRKSRTRFVRRKTGQIYQIVSFRKIRRKYNLHHIHRLHRKNTRSVRHKQFDGNKLMTPLVIDDYVNMRSGLESPTAKNKPLLIASFPNGYSRSPRVKVLQKNKLYRLWISRRRYRLRKYNPGLPKCRAQGQETDYDECVRSCRVIKKQASKYADVKFNFERPNVVKTVCIPVDHLKDRKPQFLEFHPDRSIRLDEFTSLSRARNSQLDSTELVEVHMEAGPGFLSLVKRRVISEIEKLHWRVSEIMPRTSLSKHPDVIIWSRIVPAKDIANDPSDAGAQTLHEKLCALVEASKLAGNALNSYSRMLQKLETVSPGATRTIRRATARHVAR